ncbi:MAG: glycosyltransferase [Thermoflexales bacterium]|nr:glycosyltransferase [Thermoflexales bacterium]
MMERKARPKISVIIPTRDREDVLPGCLDRLLAEPGPPFEVIVVDASSSDATQSVLSRCYPSVVNCRVGNVPYSMVSNRNIGISLARGEIVAFIDDDCYVLPGWLRELCQAFEDPQVVAAGGRIIYHPWKECLHGEPVATLDLDRDLIWAEWDRVLGHAIDVPHLPGGNCAVRREAALAVGGFDTTFTGSANLEETDFFLRVSRTGGRLVFVPTAVVEHRAVPRVDNIQRSLTNYTYRFSAVRNRLYFLRKHQAPGLGIGVCRQFRDAVVGTGKLLVDAVIFAAASMAGILIGLCTPAVSKSAGLTQEMKDT